MRKALFIACAIAALVNVTPASVEGGPYEDGRFQGRIAYSADGNHNDPDDWAASPVALAIFAECGLKDRLVHFDYNCILTGTDPQWEKIHAESVLGAAERYGYDASRFYDCRQDLDAAVADIAKAIDESSAEDPLYFIVAGPMQVPVMGILKSDPEKQKHVYCISHSRWNDGFSRYRYTHTKRDVIATGVHWVQIADQNRLLSLSPYGRPAEGDEWGAFQWMRDSKDSNVRFLWERMKVSTRPDPSDAGMAYFLATGDEQADPAKLKRLLDDKQPATPAQTRNEVRLEAENFRHLEGFELEDTNDRQASHRLQVKSVGDGTGRIRAAFEEPYTAPRGQYDVEIRYRGETGCRFALLVNGAAQGTDWESPGEDRGWATHTIRGVEIGRGDEIAVTTEAAPAKLDYVQLNVRSTAPQTTGASRAAGAGELDDPQALPGQIIVAGSNPGYLKYNGGGPVFLCGPDNPEEFLYKGALQPDGTRSGGGQEEMIDRMARAGVNAFHCQMFRMRRCNIKDEGDDTHCPFVDHDPAQPLNDAVLDQWEGWLARLERHGINVHFEFYNDATDVERMGWTLDEDGNLHPDEERFFAGIVERFKHHKNILWGIEESLNKLPRARTPHFKKLSALLAQVDDRNHPIIHSFVTPNTAEQDLGSDGVMSDDYQDDPNIHVVTWLHVLPHGDDYEAQHREYLKWVRRDGGRFIVMKNETEHHPIDRTTCRRHQWGCALAGMHALEAQLNADKPERRDWIGDAGKVGAFMEQTDFHRMRSHDELAAGSTKWVLARPGESYIAYTYDGSGPMGVKGLLAGEYDLLWFDTVDGDEVRQPGVTVSEGGAMWDKPASIGNEVALSIRRR